MFHVQCVLKPCFFVVVYSSSNSNITCITLPWKCDHRIYTMCMSSYIFAVHVIIQRTCARDFAHSLVGDFSCSFSSVESIRQEGGDTVDSHILQAVPKTLLRSNAL